jgi:hypothetical protein
MPRVSIDKGTLIIKAERTLAVGVTTREEWIGVAVPGLPRLLPL